MIPTHTQLCPNSSTALSIAHRMMVLSWMCILLPSLVVAVYDESTAVRNMIFAGASYCDVLYKAGKTQPQSLDWQSLSPKCVQQAPDFEITAGFYNKSVDGFGFVGYSKQQRIIVASFKGTNPTNILDVMIDAKNMFTFPRNCSLNDNAMGPAHEGFCHEYHSIRHGGIVNEVLRLREKYPHFQVVVTGHSLGGALAMLLSLDLMSNHHVPVSLYTYGQPRTVASDLANKYYVLMDQLASSEMYRITHHKDVVAHLPRCKRDKHKVCIMNNRHGYHSGRQIHYNKAMTNFTECQPIDGADCNEFMPMNVMDHLIYFNINLASVCCPKLKEDNSAFENMQQRFDDEFQDFEDDIGVEEEASAIEEPERKPQQWWNVLLDAVNLGFWVS